jgi:hypothetical protein
MRSSGAGHRAAGATHRAVGLLDQAGETSLDDGGGAGVALDLGALVTEVQGQCRGQGRGRGRSLAGVEAGAGAWQGQLCSAGPCAQQCMSDSMHMAWQAAAAQHRKIPSTPALLHTRPQAAQRQRRAPSLPAADGDGLVGHGQHLACCHQCGLTVVHLSGGMVAQEHGEQVGLVQQRGGGGVEGGDG